MIEIYGVRLLARTATLAMTGCLLAAPARAAYLPFPPIQKTICTADHVVDKDKLANYILRKFPINLAAIPASNSDSATAQMLPSRHLLASGVTDLSDNFPADQANYVAIKGFMLGMLGGYQSPAYLPPPSDVSMADYFRTPDGANAIRCGLTADQKPIEAPGSLFQPPSPSQSPLRVRGKPSDLYFDRNKDPLYFAASSPATLDVTRNNVADTTAYRIVGDIGYAFPTYSPQSWSGDRIDAIVYAGANWNIVKPGTGSAVPPSASKTADFGLLLSAFAISNRGSTPWGHLFALTPDYLLNFVDDSRLLTGNLSYTPIANNVINAFDRLGSSDLWYKPIIVLKDDNGWYTDRGNASVAAVHQDYVRLGGQVGLSIVNDNPHFPFVVTTSYTRLHPIVGVTEVGYFANSLTYNLDPNKYFGITLSYTNGTREDTAQRENLWEVALSGRL
jgi:hypothetical protein